MRIEVIDDCEDVIFVGDADDFLEQNEYDEELECFLNNIEKSEIGSEFKFYGNFCEEYTITIIGRSIYDEEN